MVSLQEELVWNYSKLRYVTHKYDSYDLSHINLIVKAATGGTMNNPKAFSLSKLVVTHVKPDFLVRTKKIGPVQMIPFSFLYSVCEKV